MTEGRGQYSHRSADFPLQAQGRRCQTRPYLDSQVSELTPHVHSAHLFARAHAVEMRLCCDVQSDYVAVAVPLGGRLERRLALGYPQLHDLVSHG